MVGPIPKFIIPLGNRFLASNYQNVSRPMEWNLILEIS
jgi:hypothetical protein